MTSISSVPLVLQDTRTNLQPCTESFEWTVKCYLLLVFPDKFKRSKCRFLKALICLVLFLFKQSHPERGYIAHNCIFSRFYAYGTYSQGTCLDKVNGFSCNCDAGFSGVSCEVNVDDCRQASCGNGEIFAITFHYLQHQNVSENGQSMHTAARMTRPD